MPNGDHDLNGITDENKDRWLKTVFPIEEFKEYLARNRIQVIECRPADGGQIYTWDMSLRFGGDELTHAALARQLEQIVDQIPAYNGVKWRVDSRVVAINGQIANAQFRVTDRSRPG